MSKPPYARAGDGVFPLLDLLEFMPGVFQDHLLPALQYRHKAALAATCTKLRELIQQTVTTLNLHAGKCCLVHADQLSPKLPNIQNLSLKPGNLHEAMYVLPIFFMQDACRLRGITSLRLLDQLPDRPPDRIQCGSCLAFTSTYDLSAILVTASTCMPHLVALDFSTHYISDAECAAIALMTGLTRLQLRSTHGTKSGGLARFSTLQQLADLRLLDSNLDRFSHAGDLAMLLGRSCLTRLLIRYHPVLVPALLSALVEMQEAAEEAATAAIASPSSRRASLASPSAAATAGTAGPGTPLSPGAAGIDAAPRSSTAGVDRQLASPPIQSVAGTSGPRLPPPLQSLSIVLSPYMPTVADAVQKVAKLTNLRHLSLGWYARMGHVAAGEAADEVIPPAVQKELSQLVQLQELAIGWPVGYELLNSLAYLTGLTNLHLGRLPTDTPPQGLQLPTVKRLTMHMKTTLLFPGDDVPDWVVRQHKQLVQGLTAFPSLTAFEITGDIPATTLAHLPTVLPASLHELRLPQRMISPSRQDLAKLRQLTGLTSLRIGWRAALHDGPPSLPEEDDLIDLRLGQVSTSPAAAQEPNQLAAAAVDSRVLELPKIVSLAALTEVRELQFPAARHVKGAGLKPRPLDSAPAGAVDMAGTNVGSASVAAEGTPAVDSGSVLGLAGPKVQAAKPAVPAGQTCSVCGRPSTSGCLCRLQCLELVGPVTSTELLHLAGLPSLRSVLLRDNAAWSSGLPCDDLARLVVRCSGLRRLELVSCPGVDGLTLEQYIADLDGDRLSSTEVVVRGGGQSAVELGMGYQFVGDVFSPAQERGEDETVWWGGAQQESEQQAEGEPLIGPQPHRAPQMQRIAQKLHRQLDQVRQLNTMFSATHQLLQQITDMDVQAAGGLQDIQHMSVAVQAALHQHNALMQAINDGLQQMQMAEHMRQQLQAVAEQVKDVVAAVGGFPEREVQQWGVHWQQVGEAAAAVAQGFAGDAAGANAGAVEDG